MLYFGRGILFCLLLTGCAGENYPSQWNVDLIQEATIELTPWIDNSDTPVSDPYLFGRIGQIRSDEEQNVYISDLIRQTIKKFDQNGEFISDIGRRGRGAGEFVSKQNFTTWPDEEGEWHLTVTDDMNRVVTTLTTSGDVVFTNPAPIGHEYPRGPFRTLELDGSVQHLFVYKLFEEAADSDCLFHLFSVDFSGKIGCFGDFRDMRFHRNETFHYLVQAVPGKMVIDEDHTIYMAPRLYEGVIYTYEFDLESNSWFFSGELEGMVHHVKPIEENAEPYDYRVNYRGKQLFGQVLNESIGLFMAPSGIRHFTRVTTPDGESWIGVESYDLQGNLQNYYRLKVENTELSEQFIEVLYRNDEGDYMVTDTDAEVPSVYRMRIK